MLSSFSVSALDIPSLKELNVECNRLRSYNAVEVLLQCAAFCTSLQSLLVGANSFGEAELHGKLSKSGLPIDTFLSQRRGVLSYLSYSHKDSQRVSQSTRRERGRMGCLVVKMFVDAAAEKDRLMRSTRAANGDCSLLLVPERADFHMQQLMPRQMAADNEPSRLSETQQPSFNVDLINKLNLSGCNLRSSSLEILANVLQRLPMLHELNLSLNHFPAGSILTVLQEAQSLLSSLVICNAGITAVGLLAAQRVSPFKFVSLARLDVSDNELQAAGFAALLQLFPVQNLIRLQASNCGIDLCKCAETDDRLQGVLSIFRQTTALQHLDLSSNALGVSAVESILRAMSPDPQHFGASRSSQYSVNISWSRPPRSLGRWVSPLKYLNLSRTACDQVDASSSHHFDKWFNSILPHFTNLAHLYLSENQCLFNLSSSVSCLRHLESIDLSHCKNLLTIPDELILGSRGRNFDLRLLACDALEYPPKKIAKNGLDAIRQFVDVEDSERHSLRDVKVVFLGNGGSGKRNLLCALANIRDSEYKNFDQMNQLIRRQYLSRKTWLARKFTADPPTLSFWNLGGQLEYSSHLNFYMSARQCVYVIVFSVVDSHEILVQQISYWLRAVFGCAGSQRSFRIFLIGSHIEAVHASLLDKHKDGIRDLIKKLLVAMGVFAQVDKLIFFDWWVSADPSFPGHKEEVERITDKIVDSSAKLVSESILRFPDSYLPMLKEVKKLAENCQEKKILPLIKLADVIEEDGCEILEGSHRHLRKLEAIKLLNEVGILISYMDLHEEPWICVNLNFCVDVVMLFTNSILKLKSDPASSHESVMSKNEMHRIIQHVFETAVPSVSWYSSSLTQGYPESLFGFFVAQGLLLPVPGPRFRWQYSAADEILYVVPLLFNGRPDSWRAVFGHLLHFGHVLHDAPAAPAWGFGMPIRIKGSRFSSRSVEFMITVPTFLKLMVTRCCDSRFMWGVSFVYHVEGTSIFVRLAEDRHGIDVVTIGPEAPISAAIDREIENITLELGLNERHESLLLCPLCCTSDNYVKSGTVRVFFEQQVDHYREYGLNAVCHHNHVLEVSRVEQGAIFHMPAAPDAEGPFFPDVCRANDYV